MKTKTKILIVIALVVLVIVGVIGYMVVKDMKQEDILRTEVNSLSEKDVTKDSYDVVIKTTGDYAKVERAIKEYLNDYATTLQELLKIMEDEKLVNCLSADNYKNDGPDFTETKDYLTKTKESFNNKLDKLTDMTSEEKIMESINKQKLDSYYVDLYEELMLKGIAASDFEESQKDLQTASARINNVLNVESEVIDLLIQNKGKWSIENDKIVFQSTETLNQYNELIKKLNQ